MGGPQHRIASKHRSVCNKQVHQVKVRAHAAQRGRRFNMNILRPHHYYFRHLDITMPQQYGIWLSIRSKMVNKVKKASVRRGVDGGRHDDHLHPRRLVVGGEWWGGGVVRGAWWVGGGWWVVGGNDQHR